MPTLQIKIGQVDPAAKLDIVSIDADDAQPWSNLNDLRKDGAREPYKVATLEKNYTILDGTFAEFPDETNGKTWGMWSASLSDSGGALASPFSPSISFIFNDPHKSNGITLYFYPHTGDYADAVYVHWFADAAGTDEIDGGVFAIDSDIGAVERQVNEYKRVDITFLTTNRPHRFVKLFAIEFGLTRVIFDHEISACKVLEEIDPTSESVSVNMLDVVIRTANPLFAPISSGRTEDSLTKRQQIAVMRDNTPFGIFFLDRWRDAYQDGIEFHLSALDAISVLDANTFTGGMYANKLISDILDEIFAICFPTGLMTYNLDPEFSDERVTGWIPYGSCGVALQHIAFAIHGTVDTSRIGAVMIYPREVDNKADAHTTTNDKQAFIDAQDLQSTDEPYYFATFEPNYTMLDNSLNDLPQDCSHFNLGWCSASMSDVNGYFAVNPTVKIDFSTNHNLAGVTLRFGAYPNEYMEQIRATFYDAAEQEIFTKIYTFGENPAYIGDRVLGYRRMVIEVIKTNNPYRYAKIAYLDYGRSYWIPLTEQYRGGNDSLTEFVSGVNVISHKYAQGAEIVTALNDSMPIGRHVIQFNEPLHGLTVTGAAIVTSNVNYADINVTTAGVVTVTGKKYADNKRIHAANIQIAAGQIENNKQYDNYTLVSPDRGDMLANKLLEVFADRVRTENEVVLSDLEVGYIAQIETRHKRISGVITRLDSNLRGNRTRMEVVGRVVD